MGIFTEATAEACAPHPHTAATAEPAEAPNAPNTDGPGGRPPAPTAEGDTAEKIGKDKTDTEQLPRTFLTG